MTVTLTDLAKAYEQLLKNLGGLNAFDHPVNAPPLPAAIVVPPPIDYRQAMRAGVITLPFRIVLLEGTSSGRDQQKNLWPYLDWAGSKSILAAFDADPSLGFVGVDGLPRVDAHVMSAEPLGLEDLPEYAAIGYSLATPALVTNRE